MRMSIAVVAVQSLLIAASPALGQSSPQSLATLDGLIGKWQGASDGQPGKGTVEREYTRILRSRFVQSQNRSVYPPQEKNPKGEEHLDTAVFRFDRQRNQVVAGVCRTQLQTHHLHQRATCSPSHTATTVLRCPASEEICTTALGETY